MEVKPFRGLRPQADLASRIPSLPYDVLTSAEARRTTAGDPYSFLHVIKPEIDLPSDIDPYDDRVYAKGRENFRAMIDRGWLVRDGKPAYYVYRLVADGRAQTGIVGAAAVRDYLEGRIKKHEHTRPDKEKDRIRMNDALSAHPGPVLLAYRSLPELNAVINGIVDRDPPVRFSAGDGVEHSLWVVEDAAPCRQIESLFHAVRCTYVADGHHRAAAAAEVCRLRGARTEEPTGHEPFRYFLAAHFPSDQLRVLEYNRVVEDLNGLDPPSFIERVEHAGFHVKPNHRTKVPPEPETIGAYLDGAWYLLSPRPEIIRTEDPVRSLDVSILTERLLQPVLGIGDPRTDRRLDFVGGVHGPEELERRVDSGRAAVAFALHPGSLDLVMEVADAGLVMPPKSTWFEPKLRSGLVVQSLEGETL